MRITLVIFALTIFSSVASSQFINDSVSIYKRLFTQMDRSVQNHSNFRYINSAALKAEMSENLVRDLSYAEAIIEVHSFSDDIKSRTLPVNNLWKLSPYLIENIENVNSQDIIKFRIQNSGKIEFFHTLKNLIPSIKNVMQQGFLYWVKGLDDKGVKKLISLNDVIHADIHIKPQVERFINGLDLVTNQVNKVKSRFPHIDGQGLGVAVQENSMRLTDIDLLGKISNTDLGSPIVEDHATNMSTIIAGWGNSHRTGEGVARYASLLPIDFQFLLPMTFENYPDMVRTTNHSYGTAINNYYGIEAREFDAQVYNHPEMIHVFSAGNKGDSTSIIGVYAGLQGMANLSGSVKQAKNTILVGAIDSFGVVEERSSKGPAYDGRIKPDLVAYGEDGTSGAAAIVSGISAILQDYYLEHNGIFPKVDLIKACLIASANDIYSPGPDYLSGYGIVKAFDAINILESNQYFIGEVEANGSAVFNLRVPEGIKQARIALSWIDAPSREGDFKALVNDLDVKVINQIDEQFLPQILNAEGSKEDLLQPSIDGEDHINNSELVIINNPRSLSYSISVKAHESKDDIIPFAIAYHFIPEDSFTWEFPSSNDRIDSKRETYLRWSSTFKEGQSGSLSLMNLDNEEITFIKDIDTLKSGTYVDLDWPFGSYKLIMDVADTSYQSDTFTIYPDIQLDAINLCGNDLLLEWDYDSDAEHYQILTIREDTLIPFLTTTSRGYEFIDFSELNTPYIAVKPINDDGVTGHNSYTLNIDFVKPPCYIKSFSGFLENDDLIRLNLTLSTTREVEDIRIFRNTTGISQLLSSFTPNMLMFSTTDDNVEIGDNQYTAEIVLEDGNIISQDITIEYIPAGVFEILQNPVLEGEDIVITKNAEQAATFDLFSSTGYKVRSQPLNGSLIFIDTSDLAAGAYPYIIYSGDDVFKNGIIIII